MDDGLDVNEIKLLMDLVNDAQKIKRGKSEPKLIRKIVPVEQWLEDEYYIGKSGMYLYPYWKKEIIDVFGTNRGKYNEIIVNGGIGCLNENTRVATSVGLVTLKYLSELPSVKLAEGIKALLERVFVVSEQGSNEIQLVKDKGLSRTVLLRFKSGRTVEGTVDHKFRVLDKGTIVWKRLEDVLVGDKFHLNTERKVFGRECLDEDELHSLGALFGNARVKACGNLGVLWLNVLSSEKSLDRGMELLGLDFSRCSNSVDGYGMSWNFNYGNSNLVKEMFACKLEARIPEVVFRLNEMCLIEFLRYVFKFSSEVVDGKFRVSLNSNKSARDFASILDLFGLNYQIKEGCVYFIDREAIKFIVDKLGPFSLLECLELDSLKRTLVDVKDYDEVVSKEYSESYCRDLSVTIGHSYCVSGFMSHNTGKSTYALYCMMRKIYELSCYENVPSLFHLMPNTLLSFIYFSVSRTQAEMTGYGQFKNMIDESPYFGENFPRNEKLESMIMFPENLLYLFGSSMGHIIGMNMLGAILDEANFFQHNAQDPSKSVYEYNRVANLYDSIVNRAKSRFMSYGRDDSLSILVSSNTTASSFTENRIKKSLEDPHTKIINARLWDVKPEGAYSKEKFLVFEGSDLVDPFIIDTVADLNQVLDSVQCPHPFSDDLKEAFEEIPPFIKEKFIKVPIDFRKRFEDDIILSLQDIAGRSVAPAGRLFNSRSVYLKACSDNILKHPFYKDEIVISTFDNVKVSDFVSKDFIPTRRSKKRFIHIDQSVTTDSTGFASAYVSRYVEKDGIVKPVVAVDLQLRINPPKPPKKIAISKVRDFVFFMRDVWHLDIGKVTYDWYACVSGDTLVELEDCFKRIRFIEVGDCVRTDAGYKCVRSKFCYQDVPVVEVTLENGQSLIATVKHRLKVFVNNAWEYREIMSLQLGDIIGTASMRRKDLNSVRVKSIKRAGREDVYDITVDGDHCYFANGILCHNSQESMQVLEENGIACSHLSVDRTDDAYLTYVNMLYEGRIETYLYHPAEKELFDLIHYRDRRKVDHPTNGSKDVMDAVVGAVWDALQEESLNGVNNSVSNVEGMVDSMVDDDNDDIFTIKELMEVE